MDFELSDEQTALRDELRRFLTDRVTSEARWAAAERPGGVDRDLWSDLAGMGVFGIATPEDLGGVGLGLADATIVFEELGRAATPGPLVASFLAAGTVGGALEGTTVVGMVDGDAHPSMVEHAHGLDTLLVDRGDRVEAVAPPTGTDLPRPTDPLTPVTLVDRIPDGDVIAGAADAARLRRNGRLMTAAFQVGLGQAAVDLGTEYAKQRQQFGRTIGTFQAVKHLLADAVVSVDIARAGVHAAAVSIDEMEGADPDHALDGSGRVMSVDAARMVASHAAQLAAEACIQVHGGMGFTWELDAHLFLKRTLVLDTTFGSVHDSTDAVAASI